MKINLGDIWSNLDNEHINDHIHGSTMSAHQLKLYSIEYCFIYLDFEYSSICECHCWLLNIVIEYEYICVCVLWSDEDHNIFDYLQSSDSLNWEGITLIKNTRI